MRLIKKNDKKILFVFLTMLACGDVFAKRMGGATAAQPAPTVRPTAQPVTPSAPKVQPTAPVTRQPQQTAQPGRRSQPTTTAATQKVQPATPVAQQTQAAPVATKVQLPKITPRREKYTQMEAYLQGKNSKGMSCLKLITDHYYGDFQIVKHMDIVSRVIAAEADLRDTHWAFYHGLPNDWTVWQDAYTALFNHFNPDKAQKGDADFIFLRTTGKGVRTAQSFLVETLKKDGLIDDRTDEMKAVLISANLFLFGNTGVGPTGGESTWNYTMTAKSHAQPDEKYYTSMMDEFGLSYQYVGELIALTKTIHTQQQTLLQIFVPKSIVDQVGYLAWSRGIPHHEGSIDWVKKNQHKKEFKGSGGTSTIAAIGGLQDRFKKQQQDPYFKDMFTELLQGIEKGTYSIDDYLKRCCNDPKSVSDINGEGLQARLLFTDDVLLNPSSGIKMYRYTGMSHEQHKQYKAQLDAIIKKCIATKK